MEKTLINYIKLHNNEYGEKKIRQSLVESGYSKEEIDSAFTKFHSLNQKDSNRKNSFFKLENQGPAPKKEIKKEPLAMLAISLSIIPIIGLIIGLKATKKINANRFLSGREEAFYAIIINFLVTIFILLIILTKIF